MYTLPNVSEYGIERQFAARHPSMRPRPCGSLYVDRYPQVENCGSQCEFTRIGRAHLSIVASSFFGSY